MLKTAFTTALVLACAVMAAAQSSLTGKWQGDTDGGAAHRPGPDRQGRDADRNPDA